MKKGTLVGMGQQNSFAIFESKKMFVAVPADKLHQKLTKKVETLLAKAKEVYSETGVAFDDVLEIPENFEQKTVGLANREKITMFVVKKPKNGNKKKSQEEKKTAKDDPKATDAKS